MDRNGFTLVEMLIVLSTISILLLLAAPIQTSVLKSQEEENFLQLFKHDVLLIQNQTSITSKARIYIRFDNDHYRVVSPRLGHYDRRNYPEGWSYISYNNRELRFNESGTVIGARTMIMYSETERITFTFPLGKGRFYIGREKWVHNR